MEKDTSEIAKLTERISKDPKSKLFVPLAEEYKKAGDIEMAIQVLMDGLKSNPAYVTARSFLGRLLMDKGDLVGAQKELEEVIKAIPDNLLAQRKLGDIYVLQGNGRDAQQRYKAAFALNPSDKELPSLLSDLEAGKDVSARIPRPKVATPTVPAVPAAPQGTPAPAAAAAQPKAVPAVAVPSPVSKVVSPSAAQKTVLAAAPPAPAVTKKETRPVAPPATKAAGAPVAPVAQPRTAAPEPPAAPVPDEVEVIEDIVEIESLEKPETAVDSTAAAFEAPTVQQPEPVVPPAAFASPSFDLSETPAQAAGDAGDLADVSWGSESFSVPQVPAADETAAGADEGGDDLNTNTLAELYISQGFYDKAIEVYQGMLGDRPDNRALQLKLEKLRALMDSSDKGRDVSATAVRAPEEYSPAKTTTITAPTPPREVPSAAPPETPVSTKVAAPSPEPAPVAAVPEKSVREAAPEGTVTRGPQAATVRRKETIDRLESWLTNIMKEKK